MVHFEASREVDNARVSPWRRRAAVSSMLGMLIGAGVAIVGTAANQYQDEGSYECFLPDSLSRKQFQFDQRGITWNTAGQAMDRSGDILKFMDEGGSVAMLQEVPKADFTGYVRLMKTRAKQYAVCYVQADSKANFLDGGFGNMIIVDQIPKDVEAYRMKGRSLGGIAMKALSGVMVDAKSAFTLELSSAGIFMGLDLSMNNTKRAHEESRALLAFTLKMRGIDGQVREARYLTGHLPGYDPYLSTQRARLIKIASKNIRGTRPLVLAIDANTDPEVFVPEIDKIGMTTTLTRPTSMDGRVIDYVAYTPNPQLGFVQIQREPFATDHHMVSFSFRTNFIDYHKAIKGSW